MVIFGFFMEFIHPGVLYFLPALLIPVIVHFFNFRRYEKVYFSNVGNLMEFAKEHRSRNRIREIMLMLVRILTLLFLILAFSEPRIFKSNSGGSGVGESRNVDLYIDNSQSMNVSGDHGTLLEEVKKKVNEITDLDIPGHGALHYALLTNDFSGSDFQFLEKDELLNKVSAIRTSINHKTLDQVLSRFREIHSLSPESPKQIFLLSDFQRNTLVRADTKSFARELHSFDSLNHSLTRLWMMQPGNSSNIYIDSVWNLSPIQKVGENNALVVRIKRSYSGKTPEIKPISLPIKLILNKEIKALGLVHIQDGNPIRDTLHFQIQNPGSQEVKILIDDEPINFDNSFFASWYIPSSMDVFRIHGSPKSPFIPSVYATDPYFHFLDFDENQVDFNLLSRQNFVILDGVKQIGSGLVNELHKLEKRGGTLVYIPPVPDSSQKDLGIGKIQDFMNQFSLDKPVRWVKQDQKFLSPSLNHGLLEGVFDRFPKNLELPRVQTYLQFGSGSGTEKKTWFAMQGNEPYLRSYTQGKGFFYVFSSPFFDGYTRFMRHPFFLPLFYNLAFRSANYFPLYYTLGKKETYLTPNWSPEEMKQAIWTGDSSHSIPAFEYHGGMEINLGSGPRESGFYHLEIRGKNRQSFAFNYDRSESTLQYFKREDLGLTASDRVLGENYMFKSLQSLDENDRAFPLSIWKVCLILALLCLAIEQVLIRIKSPA